MDETLDTLIRQNIALLGQLEAMLEALPAALYRAQPARHGGSIGAQTRHVLDHYDRLLGHDGGAVDYGQRARDPRSERDPGHAARRLADIRAALYRLRRHDRPVQVRDCAQIAAPGPGSTLARELAFLASHTVHHLALIALLAEWQGQPPPAHFGVAPSTLEHRQTQATQA